MRSSKEAGKNIFEKVANQFSKQEPLLEQLVD